MIFHANAATCMPDQAFELLVPALMPPRACAVHARHMHARRWHRMGDKCTPAAPNQLLTGILASIMQSSCLFKRNPADNAACAPRCTAAQPCRPAPRMLQKAKFVQVTLVSVKISRRENISFLPDPIFLVPEI